MKLLSQTIAFLFIFISTLNFTIPNLSAKSQASHDETYTFRFSDEELRPIVVSLEGAEEVLVAGDMAFTRECLLSIGRPGIYNLQCDLDEEGCVYLINLDGSRTIVGVRIGDVQIREKIRVEKDPNTADFPAIDYHDPNVAEPMKIFLKPPAFRLEITYKFVNPLDNMSAEQIQELWWIIIDDWKGDFEDKLKYIDPNRTWVSIADSPEQKDKSSLSFFPEQLRYLSISDCFRTKEEMSQLSKFTYLKFLIVHDLEFELDISMIQENTELLYLSFTDNSIELKNVEALSNLRNLCVLNMAELEDLEDISFVASLKSLQKLDISGTGVEDLSYLTGLENLTKVQATMAPVAILPKGKLPKLETLWIMGSKLSLEDIEEFERNNPYCAVIYGWNRSIYKALAGTTRIEVQPYLGGWLPLFVENDIHAISNLVENLRFDPCELDVSTLCTADLCLVFCNDDIPLETLEIVCSGHIRWDKGWPSEVMLTQASGDYLANWLGERGIEYMLDEREKMKDEDKAAREKMEETLYEFLAILPDDLATAIEERYKYREEEREKRQETMSLDIARRICEHQVYEDVISTIKSHIPDDKERAELCLKMFAKSGPSPNYYDYALRNILRELDEETKRTAVEKLLADPNGKCGVAKWIFDMHGWEELDSNYLEEILIPVAHAGLTNHTPPERMRIIRTLGRIRVNPSRIILRQILNNTLILPELKPQNGGPEKPIPLSTRPFQYSYQAEAALSLAELRDAESLPLIQDLCDKADGADRRIFEMALERLLEPEPEPESLELDQLEWIEFMKK